ncbi:TPA: hypothetical protein ACSP93_004540, partial [Aeromonas hydrophila]
DEDKDEGLLSSKFEIIYDNDYKTSQARLKSIHVTTNIEAYGTTNFFVERVKTRGHYYLNPSKDFVEWVISTNPHVNIENNKLSDFLLKNYLRIEKGNRLDFELLPPTHTFESRSDASEIKNLAEEIFDIFNESFKLMLSTLDSKTYYLAPIRFSPLRSYKRSSHSKSIGINGSHSASVLANLQAAASRGSTIESKRLAQFNEWLHIIFPNTKVKAHTIDELVKLKLENVTRLSNDTITDVGFGFSQI